MIGQAFIPSPPLRPYLRSYQLWHFIFPDKTKLPFKPYAPRPEQTLVFCPRGFELVEYVSSGQLIKRPESYLIGQYTERTNRHIGSQEFLAILVNFQPGVLFRITGIPYQELTNSFIDGEDVFSKEIRQVNERLNSSEDYQEMIGFIENFLFLLIKKIKMEEHPIDRVTKMLVDHPEHSSLLHLAKESFLCSRQFERKFRERMGIRPKLFTRIARANKAFKIKYTRPNQDWLSIALECGYHDYQHLAKDFIDFAGLTPAAYLSEDQDQSPERYFGLSDTSLSG
jgi:AraC-like DNA-binding protein